MDRAWRGILGLGQLVSVSFFCAACCARITVLRTSCSMGLHYFAVCSLDTEAFEDWRAHRLNAACTLMRAYDPYEKRPAGTAESDRLSQGFPQNTIISSDLRAEVVAAVRQSSRQPATKTHKHESGQLRRSYPHIHVSCKYMLYTHMP